MSTNNSPPSETRVQATEARVTIRELNYLMLAGARFPVLYANMEHRIHNTMFHPHEAPIILFWRSLVNVKCKSGLPLNSLEECKDLMKVAASKEVASNSEFYKADHISLVVDDGGMIDTAFKEGDPSPEIQVFCIDILKKFLSERLLLEPLKSKIINVSDQNIIKDPYKIISDAEKLAAEISGIGTDPGADAVSSDLYVPSCVKTFPTSITWLDKCMGGGHAPGECYLVMGGTGSGKSALMIQLAVSGARIQASNYVGNGNKRIWLYFSYELNTLEIQERVHSFGACIDVNTFRSADPSQRAYSRKGGPYKDYEGEAYVNPHPEYKQSESERLEAFQNELSGSWLRVVDYSGTYQGTGVGGVPEITNYCRQVKQQGYDIAGVVIDYAGLVTNRYRINNSRMKPGDEYELLNGFADQIKFKLATPYHCPVWVLHQLRGDVRNASSTRPLRISDARGGRNLGDNCDFVFILGSVDKSGMRTVWMDKSRRVKSTEEPIIVHFDGRYGVMLEPPTEYLVDKVSHRIVQKRDMDQLFSNDLPSVGDMPSFTGF